MSPEGGAVVEGGVALRERLEKSITGDHRPNGGITTGHALGAGNDVGDIVKGRAGEHFADAAKGTDDFVAD
ncbi:unannotated protein [freshwater metagenome]|uniref:Unannotated protein n=1 Tax=freshwater metagenome TaxID=449393 RepID=A0A6J6JQ02_9ZZZZ